MSFDRGIRIVGVFLCLLLLLGYTPLQANAEVPNYYVPPRMACQNNTDCTYPDGSQGGYCAIIEPGKVSMCYGCGGNGDRCEHPLGGGGASYVASTVPFVESRTINGVTYGALVCHITAPCSNTWKQCTTPSVPTSFNLTKFGLKSPLCAPNTGAADNYCMDDDYNVVTQPFRHTVSPKTQETVVIPCKYLDRVPDGGPKLTSAYWKNVHGFKLNRTLDPCQMHPDRCASGTCWRQTGRHQLVEVDGVMRRIYSTDICCPLGRIGDRCEIDSGCLYTGCKNGGTCLTHDKSGRALAAQDTRCFGCTPGINGTLGWTGIRCDIPDTPTFIPTRNGTNVSDSSTGGSGRRLLQLGGSEEDDYFVRYPQGNRNASSGSIYREPARVCDCGVSWSDGDRDFDGLHLMWMGNYPHSTTKSVLLSPVRYDTEASSHVKPIYLQTVRTLPQAQYLCAVDEVCGGVTYDNATGVFAAFERYTRAWQTEPGLAMNSSHITPTTQRYVLTRLVNPGQCLDSNTTLDPEYYCATYPKHCDAIRASGGVGNIRINGTTATTKMVASLHYQAYGHLVRNRPNPTCDLTVQYAEDEVGCVNILRVPKAPYALAPGERLTAEICGNSSAVDESRVANGPLLDGVTGTNITNGLDEMCQCYPPFSVSDDKHQDCVYDLCGAVEGRGRINATYANALDHPSHFNHTDSQACECYYPWGTDPASCTGPSCNWCAATACLNGGTADGRNYSLPCACNDLFTGERCEINKCNATNSHPFNYSQWVDAGGVAEQIACDCLPGWTGQFCDIEQCIYGFFNRDTLGCDCIEGYTSSVEGFAGRCDQYICAEGHGFFVATYNKLDIVDQVLFNGTNSTDGQTFGILMNVTIPGHCECHKPWAGERCLEHTCDSGNPVLGIVGWAGVRPFGVPKPTENNNATWECSCTWPYMPRPNTEGRPLDCMLHDCNFGVPNGNASLVKSPSDACTCQQSGTGIHSDPALCTGFSHDDCPNACRRGVCSVPSEVFAATGITSVQIGDTPDCCRCVASLGYNINGECQPFCAFYQPCITTPFSSFMPNPDYNASLEYEYENPNVTRVANGNEEWICGCNAGCRNTDLTHTNGMLLNDCANCTFVAREIGIVDEPPSYVADPPPDDINTPPSNGTITDGTSTGSTTSKIIKSPAFIAGIAAAGIVVLAAAAAVIQSVMASRAASSAVASSSSSSVPAEKPIKPATVSGKASRTRLGKYDLISAMMLIAISGCTAQPFVFPATQHWDRWYVPKPDPNFVATSIERISMTSASSYPFAGSTAMAPFWTIPALNGKSTWTCDNGWIFNRPLDNCIGEGCHVEYNSGEITMPGVRAKFGKVAQLQSHWLRSVEWGGSYPTNMLPAQRIYSSPPWWGYTASDAWEHTYNIETGSKIQIGDAIFERSKIDFSLLTYGETHRCDLNDWNFEAPSNDLRTVAAIDTFDLLAHNAFGPNIHNSNTCNGGKGVIRVLDTPNGEVTPRNLNAAGVAPAGPVGKCGIRHEYRVNNMRGDQQSCTKISSLQKPWTSYTYVNSALYVRGCECQDGRHGLQCEKTCPSNTGNGASSPLCSGHGVCPSHSNGIGVTRTDNDGVRYCLCPNTCICDPGYRGRRCEQAVWESGVPITASTAEGNANLTTLGANMHVHDYSECCPFQSVTCTPIASITTTNVLMHRSNPTMTCGSSTICPTCTSSQCSPMPRDGAETNLLWQHSVFYPLEYTQCGNGDNTVVKGWQPTQGIHSGRGMCDIGRSDKSALYDFKGVRIPEGKGFCWCNNPGFLEVVSNPLNRNPRRGWFGPKCEFRTCVDRVRTSTRVLAPSGAWADVLLSSPSGIQCNNHTHPRFSMTSTNNYQDTATPCNDIVVRTNVPAIAGYKITNINTEGVCRGCADGWGVHPGYSKATLLLLGFPTTENGLCGTKTMHSNSDAACGGYGTVTKQVVPAGTYADVMVKKSVDRVTSCTCPTEYGLRLDASGICQRTCAGDGVPEVVEFSKGVTFNEFGDFNGTINGFVRYNTTVVRCGGYQRGICRPIVEAARGGGWNSACACNPGYNGPRCDKQDSMWFKGTLCGPDGESVLVQPPANEPRLATSADEDYFRRYIVPLDGAALNNKVYSAYKCQCKAPARALNYSLNANGICGPSCDSPNLQGANGLRCSGHGQCIDDPRPNTAGKVCRCDLGWDGLNCGRANLRDQLKTPPITGLGQVCGGLADDWLPRGKIVYEAPYNMTQRCECRPPFVPNNNKTGESYGLCWRGCPNNCTSEAHGRCIVDPVTGNDNICKCTENAFTGKDCSRKLVAVYLTQSGSELPCTGHGVGNPNETGACLCDDDYIGPACEVYRPNRLCGWGQTFMDSESLGVRIK